MKPLRGLSQYVWDNIHIDDMTKAALIPAIRSYEEVVAELKTELLAVLDVAIARGEKLGYIESDNDYKERVRELKEAQ